MIRTIFCLVFAVFLVTSGAASAQNAFVQVEAHPSLRVAEERARAYGTAFEDMNGFRLSSGWYALALGPYSEQDARARLRELRGAGLIPQDAYISDAQPYGERFWPVGGGFAQPQAAPQSAPVEEAEAEETLTIEPTAPVEIEETPRQARASEALLSRDEKKQLQVAMQWFGHYRSAIDGSFGRGTRAAMGRWQETNGLQATGVMTTKQRKMLLESYETALAALGLGEVVEKAAGISITMPAKLVEFEKYEYPFVYFTPKDDSGVRVLLISQAGDDATLGGLYEIMQTLEIVPPKGERNKNRNSFTLTGQNDQVHSYTYAALGGGYVKGFTLAYPPARASDMARVIEIMRGTFKTSEGSLDPSYVNTSEQAVDLLSGLEQQRPKISRSGFYVDGRGRVVTHASAVAQCKRITLDETYEADISAIGGDLALLEPKSSIVPLNYARFASRPGRLRSEIAVSGYSYEGALEGPTLTYGKLADLRGLNGDDSLHRLALEALPGDIGGPVLDRFGAVAGMLMPSEIEGRTLPQGTSFAKNAEALARFLSENGLTAASLVGDTEKAPEDLGVAAADMTVLVRCW